MADPEAVAATVGVSICACSVASLTVELPVLCPAGAFVAVTCDAVAGGAVVCDAVVCDAVACDSVTCDAGTVTCAASVDVGWPLGPLLHALNTSTALRILNTSKRFFRVEPLSIAVPPSIQLVGYFIECGDALAAIPP